jgi:hypothetical protein
MCWRKNVRQVCDGLLTSPDDVLGDAGLADCDPQLEEFTVEARRTPKRVGHGHRANQVTDVERHGRPPQASTTLPGPEQAERLPLPGDDGVRFDDHERRGPLAPDPREPNPEKAVRPGEAWPVRARSLQHPNLMTQGEQFEVQGGA